MKSPEEAKIARRQELKLCPFCGAEGILTSDNPAADCIWYAVRCTTCYAEAEQGQTIAEAMKHWNRRVKGEKEC